MFRARKDTCCGCFGRRNGWRDSSVSVEMRAGAGFSVDELAWIRSLIFPVDGKNGGAALSISDDGDGLIITRDRFGEIQIMGTVVKRRIGNV